MDTNHSDRETHIREALANPWGTFWDHEDGSDSGLALGGSTDLGNLVEDKEIAARAVAFVVNSTRKGIVPLCADIATLFCQKRTLEEKVVSLKRQNEVLHIRSTASSLRTSHSTSPTPPSIHSHSDHVSLVEHNSQTRSSLSSRPPSSCSQCSGINNNHSNKSKKSAQNLHNNNNNNRKNRQSSTSSCEGQTFTTAIIHSPPPDSISTSTLDVDVEHTSPGDAGEKLASIVQERRDSLPEITSQPSDGLPKISPCNTRVSREVQCQIIKPNDPKLEDQFRETVKMNSRLAEDLGAARKEIEILKGRLKELEMINLARHYTGQYSNDYHIENECAPLTNGVGGTDSDVSETSTSSLPVVREKPSRNSHSTSPGGSSVKAKPIRRTQGGQICLPTAMPGCVCTLCQSAEGPRLKTGREVTRVTVNGKLQIQLDDYVVVKGDKTGHIRYIGHLDKIGSPNMVFVGLELDAPVGRHDGNFNGKKYFSCSKDYGVFVPIQDVTAVMNRKHTSRKSKPSATSLQRKSSSESDNLTARSHRSKHSTSTSSDSKRRSSKEKSSERKLITPDMYTSKTSM